MDIPTKPENIAQTTAALVRQALSVQVNVERKGVAIFPTGTVLSLENELLEPNPKRPRANVRLYEAQSFIDYVKRFSVKDSSVIFGKASETGGSFASIIDFHDAVAKENALPRWGEHNVSLVLTTTPEWSRWLGSNNKPMTQEAFVEFIEDNSPDILDPDAATLLDMAQFLQGKKTVTFKSGKNLRNGATEFQYTEQIDEGAGRRDDVVQFPSFMTIRLFPFVGSAGADIRARLRFRISDSGKLSFQFILDRPFKVLEAAFNAIAAQIETDTGITVMLGEGSVTPPPTIR